MTSSLSQDKSPRSVSYPYLQVAREHGVPYGLVLSYADLIEVKRDVTGGSVTFWTEPSRFDESSAWAAAARTAWWREHARQTGGTFSSIQDYPVPSYMETKGERDAYLENVRRSFSYDDGSGEVGR